MAGIIIIIKERDYGHPEKPPLTRKAPGRVDLISWLTERWREKKKKKKRYVSTLIENLFKLCWSTFLHWSRVVSSLFINALIDSHVHLLFLLCPTVSPKVAEAPASSVPGVPMPAGPVVGHPAGRAGRTGPGRPVPRSFFRFPAAS